MIWLNLRSTSGFTAKDFTLKDYSGNDVKILEPNVSKIVTNIAAHSGKVFQNKVKNISFEISGGNNIVLIESDQIDKFNMDKLPTNIQKEITTLISSVNNMSVIKNKDALVGASTLYKFQLEDSRSFSNNIRRFFKRIFSFYYVVSPLIEKKVVEALAGIDVNGLKKFYINNNDLVKQIKNEFSQKPEVMNLFTEGEIENLIYAELVQKINTTLSQNKKPVWNDSKISELKIKRHIRHLQSEPNALFLIEQLKHADPLKLSFSKLAKIPLTQTNKESLLALWKTVITEIYTKGDFDQNLDKETTQHLIIQSTYSQAYSSAFEHIPSKIKGLLLPTVQLKKWKNPSEIENLMIQKLAKSDHDFGPLFLGVNGKTYRDKIDTTMKSMIRHEIFDSKDAPVCKTIRLLNILSGTAHFQEKSNHMITSFNKSLTEDEKKFFTPQRLKDLLYSEAEKVAVFEFHLLSSQIDVLRNERIKIFENNGYFSKLTNLFRGNKSPLSPTELILDKKIIDGVAGSGEEHVFDVEEMQFMMRLESILSSKKDLSPQELDKLKKESLKYANNKSFDDKIKSFFPVEVAEFEPLIETLGLPSFIKKTAKFFIERTKTRTAPAEIPPAGIKMHTIYFINKYFNAIKSTSKLETQTNLIINKVDALTHKYKQNPDSITENDKVTMNDLKKLIMVKYLKEDLKKIIEEEKKAAVKGASFFNFSKNAPINKIETIEEFIHNDETVRLLKFSEKASDALEKLNKIILPAINKHYVGGSLLAHSARKKVEWHDRPLPIVERATALLINGYTHGGIIFHRKGEAKISHMVSTHTEENVELYQACVSDIYEIDLTSQFNVNLIDVLKLTYGDKWQEIVNNKYQKISNKMHKTSIKFSNLSNPAERRLFSALADSPNVCKFAGVEVGNHKYANHKPNNFKKIHQAFKGNKLIGSTLGYNVICSEFASKGILAAMMELNIQISEDINSKMNKKYDPATILKDINSRKLTISQEAEKYLKGRRESGKNYHITKTAENELINLLLEMDYSDNEVDLIIRIGNCEIFDNPYETDEKFEEIHPGRMISLLKDKGCIKLKPVPKEMTSLIKFN